MNKEKIQKEVDDFYTKISLGDIKTEISPLEIYKSLSYNEEDLKDLPDGVNLGLSCGNPLEKLIIKDGENLLDLGSGSGLDIFVARKRFPNGSIFYGIDRLEKMVERANKIKEVKNFNNVEFKVASLTALPFENETIDHIISNCVINLETEKEKAYSEIFRVLKKGGNIVISDTLLKKDLSDELKDSPNLYGSWVGGAIKNSQLVKILKDSGFKNICIVEDEVTDEYSKKWGFGLMIKEYIKRGLIMANK